MLRHQRLQNIPQIFSIIGQCIDVLRNTVMTPDQGFSIEIKTTVNKQRDRRKNNRTVEFFDPSVHLRIDNTEIQIQDICDLTGDVFETIEISC